MVPTLHTSPTTHRGFGRWFCRAQLCMWQWRRQARQRRQQRRQRQRQRQRQWRRGGDVSGGADGGDYHITVMVGTGTGHRWWRWRRWHLARAAAVMVAPMAISGVASAAFCGRGVGWDGRVYDRVVSRHQCISIPVFTDHRPPAAAHHQPTDQPPTGHQLTVFQPFAPPGTLL